jgi:hypothetical protein
VWTLDAEVEPDGADELALEPALETIRRLRTAPEPWQRADATVQRVRELGRPVRAFGSDGGAVVFRAGGPALAVLQIGAGDEPAAGNLFRAVRAEGTSVHVLNLPTDQPAAAALRSLGGRVDVRQHELALAL